MTRHEITLPPEEREALAHAAAGLCEAEIAAAMGFSDRTLRRRLRNATEALRARNITQAVAIAVALGLVHVEGVTSLRPRPTARRRDRLRDDPAIRERIVAAVQAGSSVADAARGEGLSPATVWGYANGDRAFRAALDQATTAHRTCTSTTRGRPSGYRLGCRCPECRAGHLAQVKRYL